MLVLLAAGNLPNPPQPPGSPRRPTGNPTGSWCPCHPAAQRAYKSLWSRHRCGPAIAGWCGCPSHAEGEPSRSYACYAELGISAKMPSAGKCRAGSVNLRKGQGMISLRGHRLGIFQRLSKGQEPVPGYSLVELGRPKRDGSIAPRQASALC